MFFDPPFWVGPSSSIYNVGIIIPTCIFNKSMKLGLINNSGIMNKAVKQKQSSQWTCDSIGYKTKSNKDNLKKFEHYLNSFQAISVFGEARIYFSLAKQHVNFLQKELAYRNICTNFGSGKRDLQQVKITHTFPFGVLFWSESHL
jgi:hypothetical protein